MPPDPDERVRRILEIAACGGELIRLHQAGAAVSSIAQLVGMTEQGVERVVGAPTVNEYQPVLACSFCTMGHRRLIAGPGVYICSECVEDAHQFGAGGGEASAGLHRDHPTATRAASATSASSCLPRSSPRSSTSSGSEQPQPSL